MIHQLNIQSRPFFEVASGIGLRNGPLGNRERCVREVSLLPRLCDCCLRPMLKRATYCRTESPPAIRVLDVARRHSSAPL